MESTERTTHMRSDDDRMRLIKGRTAELKREKKRRRQSTVTVLSIAASFFLILGMGTLLSSFQGAGNGRGNGTVQMAGGSGAASLISSNSALGLIIMGILAFFLGVCVTVLLYRVRGAGKREKEDEF